MDDMDISSPSSNTSQAQADETEDLLDATVAEHTPTQDVHQAIPTVQVTNHDQPMQYAPWDAPLNNGMLAAGPAGSSANTTASSSSHVASLTSSPRDAQAQSSQLPLAHGHADQTNGPSAHSSSGHQDATSSGLNSPVSTQPVPIPRHRPVNIDTAAANNLNENTIHAGTAGPSNEAGAHTGLTPSFANFSTNETTTTDLPAPTNSPATAPFPPLSQSLPHRFHPLSKTQYFQRLRQLHFHKRPPFNIWPHILRRPEIMLYMIPFFPPRQVLHLYSIDRRFHWLTNSFLPQLIAELARRWCRCTPDELVERYEKGYFDGDGFPAALGFQIGHRKKDRNNTAKKGRDEGEEGNETGKAKDEEPPRLPYHEPDVLKMWPFYMYRSTTLKDPRRIPIRDDLFKPGGAAWKAFTLRQLEESLEREEQAQLAASIGNTGASSIANTSATVTATATANTNATATANSAPQASSGAMHSAAAGGHHGGSTNDASTQPHEKHKMKDGYDINTSQSTPSFKYLSMLLKRCAVIRGILSTLYHEHQIILSPWTAHALAKLWLFMDLPTTPLRIGLIHNTQVFTPGDLRLVLYYSLKLDLATNDPLSPAQDPANNWPANQPAHLFRPAAKFSLRTYCMACPSLKVTLEVLRRRRLGNPLEVIQAIARIHPRLIPPRYHGHSVFGLSSNFVGTLIIEGWGQMRVSNLKRRGPPLGIGGGATSNNIPPQCKVSSTLRKTNIQTPTLQSPILTSRPQTGPAPPQRHILYPATVLAMKELIRRRQPLTKHEWRTMLLSGYGQRSIPGRENILTRLGQLDDTHTSVPGSWWDKPEPRPEEYQGEAKLHGWGCPTRRDERRKTDAILNGIAGDVDEWLGNRLDALIRNGGVMEEKKEVPDHEVGSVRMWWDFGCEEMEATTGTGLDFERRYGSDAGSEIGELMEGLPGEGGGGEEDDAGIDEDVEDEGDGDEGLDGDDDEDGDADDDAGSEGSEDVDSGEDENGEEGRDEGNVE
ncbi:MAG: hypothetical protein Q9162_000336 [Coniocarpon cinnabarinum]